MAGKDYAVVIGIDDYADPKLKLSGARNDAVEFVAWLRSPSGGNLDEDAVEPFMLLSDPGGTTPNLGDVFGSIKKLLALSDQLDARIGRRLYIFLAGHGVGPELDDAGLLTVDTDSDLGFTPYLEGRRCANLFRSLALFEEIVLCMDCCRDFDPTLPPQPFPFKAGADPAAQRVKRCYVYATGFGRKSREMELDGKVHGIFTRALIDGLKGEAADAEGRITGARLESFLKRRMAKLRPAGTDQAIDPRIDPDLVIAEGLLPNTAKVTVTLAQPELGFEVLHLHSTPAPVAIEAQDLGGGRRQFELGVGRIYAFRVFDAEGRLLRERVQVVEHADEEIDVEI